MVGDNTSQKCTWGRTQKVLENRDRCQKVGDHKKVGWKMFERQKVALQKTYFQILKSKYYIDPIYWIY